MPANIKHDPQTTPDPKVLTRYGGRHLIFRVQESGKSLFPKPYLLISSLSGPVWFFYGVGQIWLTHRKCERLGNWIVRAPRFRSRELLLDYRPLRQALETFVEHCQQAQITGTLVMERSVLEFHWMRGLDRLSDEENRRRTEILDKAFQELVANFRHVPRTERDP